MRTFSIQRNSTNAQPWWTKVSKETTAKMLAEVKSWYKHIETKEASRQTYYKDGMLQMFTKVNPIKLDRDSSQLKRLKEAWSKRFQVHSQEGGNIPEVFNERYFIVEFRKDAIWEPVVEGTEVYQFHKKHYKSFSEYVKDFIISIENQLERVVITLPVALELDTRLRSRRILRNLFKSLDGEGDDKTGATFSFNIHQFKILCNKKLIAF